MFQTTTEFLRSLISSIPGGEKAFFVLILVLSLFFSYLASVSVMAILSFLTRKTKTTLDDEILKKLRMPLFGFLLLTAVYMAALAFYKEATVFGLNVFDLYLSVTFVITAFAINRVIDALLAWYGREITTTKRDKKRKDAFPFVRNVVKIIIYIVFLAIILERLGIEIAPLLAGLGIAGLAVALALQDTLSNFFAGLHILADKPFREGDYIRLESGLEGTIDSIGWRSTKLRQAANSQVIIPNAKLAQNVIINLSMPDERISVAYDINISSDEDVKEVEDVILVTLKTVQAANPDLFKDDMPWVRLEKFGDVALIFRYGYTVNSYAAQFNALKAVNEALFYAFKKKNIKLRVLK